MTNAQKEFGAYLKKCREEKNITQKEISDRMNYLTPQFVSNWERGVVMPPKKDLKRIFRMLGCDYELTKRRMYGVDLEKLNKKYGY